MANFTAESYSQSALVLINRYGHSPTQSYSTANLVTQANKRYCTTVSALPALAGIPNRIGYPPLPGKWTADIFAGGAVGGVASNEFPTVYGYIQ